MLKEIGKNLCTENRGIGWWYMLKEGTGVGGIKKEIFINFSSGYHLPRYLSLLEQDSKLWHSFVPDKVQGYQKKTF